MTINDLLQLARNKLLTLQRSRESAWNSGNVKAIAAIDEEVETTQETISALETLVEA